MKSSYESPLSSRYASCEMQALFSPDHKFKTWRKLWIALAEAERELGLPITEAQIAELKKSAGNIDYAAAHRYEERLRHDVMAHIHAYGDQCPTARGIIHLGATSCYVTDNTDALILRDGLMIIRRKILEVLRRLRVFALKYKDLPTLGYTHLQPAQPVTVGKRATLWMQDLTMDIADIDHLLSAIKLLGNKGATGTQASFLALFSGDEEKVRRLESRIAEKMGMPGTFSVSGQTYPRKMDSRILSALSGAAQSAYKFAQDIRLLQSFHELEEPFEAEQVGSSAMAYKRNPMRSERICALARHVMALTIDADMTAATQWLERTLDDSANRRLSLPEAFLALDGVLELYANIAGGIVVYPEMIKRRMAENLPFMATEDILMESVARGGDRQALHERLRIHANAATYRMRAQGKDNDLIRRIAEDEAFPLSPDALFGLLDPKRYVGMSVAQVDEFIQNEVDPLLKATDPLDIGKIKR